MRKLLVTASLMACTLAAAPSFADPDNHRCGLTGAGASLGGIDPFFYNGNKPDGRTDSGIPHLPAYYGSMSTNNTYRFFNINEMVATMIGEGKHGMWRYQDNGTVREYLSAGQVGLAVGADTSTAASVANYTHIDAAASWNGYRSDAYHPGNPGEIIDQLTGVTDAGTPANPNDDYLVWVDLPISHPKYANAYTNHVPLDLPGWYCTMSGPEYPYAREAVRFAFGQPGANQVGPLGKRAGLDIRQNYLNVLRLKLFPDANAWVNTESEDNINWKPVNSEETPYEIYLVERPFFNEEYLFYIAVFADSKKGSPNFSYIRPNGPYYDHLMARKKAGEKLPTFNTVLKPSPGFGILKPNNNGKGEAKGKRSIAVATNLFGVHHPGDPNGSGSINPATGLPYTIPDGGCPAVGGDYGAAYYGASWPNTYQEVTPLCDAVMVDIKAYANLDDADNNGWRSPAKYLPNATIDGEQNLGDLDHDGDALTREYSDTESRAYGVYTDPYLGIGTPSPESFVGTGTQSKTFQTKQDAVSAKPAAPFVPSL